MFQHLTTKGVIDITGKSNALQRLGYVPFCAFIFLFFSSLFSQNTLFAQTPVNSALPGLGTIPRTNLDNTASPPPAFAGSLELLPETFPIAPVPIMSIPAASQQIQQAQTAGQNIPLVQHPTFPNHLGQEMMRYNNSGQEVVQTQFISSNLLPQMPQQESGLGFRRVSLISRSDRDINFQTYDAPGYDTRSIIVLSGGLNLIIEGISTNHSLASGLLAGDTIDIVADNAVVWTENPGKLHGTTTYTESESLDFEIYLEGNIVYRNGPRVIRANKMYYDAKYKVAYILDGELFAPIDDIDGLEGFVRLKADIMRQMGEGQITATNAMVTTSMLGEPTYALRSNSLRLDNRKSFSLDGAEPKVRRVVVAENNYVSLRKLPVFYWPWIATDVEKPTFYLENFSYGSSGRNGHTIKTRWDPFQILNIRRPDGVDGEVLAGWMEKRGVNYGANFQYGLPAFCGVPGPTRGKIDYWAIHDSGTDRLGGERKNIGFPNTYRYQFHWLHQQDANLGLPFLGGNWDIRGEVGKTSDRNFLNSYFNSAWHTKENATTAIDLTRREGNSTIGLSAEYALDKHYTNANWLPRLDHYLLGQSLLNDLLTWHTHSRVGLVDYRVATSPSDPIDNLYFNHLDWERGGTADGTGLAFSNRHEVALPMQWGVMKVVPYVLGDFSAWGHDQTGNSADRLYGQGGVRMNVPIWKVNPRMSSRIWYLNGLAHKIDLNAEYMIAEANHGMNNLVLTDPIDNWSLDDFRRRYITHSHFAGGMPRKFDPRYYALRSGMAGNVTAGNMEIADDMHMFRLGTTHRFQTKRGSVGNRHIMDWITVSSHVNLYPKSEHNHGENIGLFDYDVLWHVGDRFSLFSEGLYDFFSDGQKITRLGGVWNRPDRANVSLMVDQFSGIIDRTYLTMSIGYVMNEKYSMAYRTSYDLKKGDNVGHNLLFIRSGESFRWHVGAVYSEALSEWSFSIGLEPVFLRSNRLRSAMH